MIAFSAQRKRQRKTDPYLGRFCILFELRSLIGALWTSLQKTAPTCVSAVILII